MHHQISSCLCNIIMFIIAFLALVRPVQRSPLTPSSLWHFSASGKQKDMRGLQIVTVHCPHTHAHTHAHTRTHTRTHTHTHTHAHTHTTHNLMHNGILVVLLDLHEHVGPGPVVVMVLQCRHCHQLVLEVLETDTLTLRQEEKCSHFYSYSPSSLDER